MKALLASMGSRWPIVTLDDIKSPSPGSLVGGPFGSELTSSHYVPSPGVPVIRGTNLDGKSCRFIDDGFVFVSETKADELSRNMAFPGDIVFTQRGTLGQVAEIPEHAKYQRYVISQSQMKLATDPAKAIARFVYYWYRSPLAQSYIEVSTLATGVPHINLGILKAFPIPLPPLGEQKKLVNIFDKADAIRRKRREAIALTEQLLRSTFLEMFGDPVTNPKRWPQVPMAEILTETQYGTSAKANTERLGLPVLRMNNLTYSGGLDLRDIKWCEIAPQDIPAYTVNPGDILFNRTNSPELVGKTAVWTRDEKFAFAGYLIRLRFIKGKALPHYISGFLNSEYGKRTLFTMQKTSNNMSNISATDIRRIQIPLPGIEQQRKYTDFVEALLRGAPRRQEALAEADNLFNSLVQRAFTGQL